ncbi:hypothetical protein JCM19037_3777 [Geomicrobium sp. JCM 19037]|uniref:hypothetical protein n=1 Tax=Geomicrobium sp. JCM 19037 TaxID=1460634 RepID=UPI00045F2E05|nr:hypothetical protein [Geomicrobium sp. JCM 19037]GAK05292.1 hypothetical protein JCM19037_3777 [Geomicrobium sp. JCM 19037]
MKFSLIVLMSLLAVGCSSTSNSGGSEAQERLDETAFTMTIPEHNDYDLLSIYIEESEGLEILYMSYGIATSDTPSTELEDLAEEEGIELATETIYGTYEGDTIIDLQVFNQDVQMSDESDRIEHTIADHTVYESTTNPRGSYQWTLNGYSYLVTFFDESHTEDEQEEFIRKIITENEG